MKLLFIKLALRNLFRNKTRTFMLLAVIGVCAAVISLIGGFYDYLFQNTRTDIIRNEGHIKLIRAKTEKKEADWITDYGAWEKSIKQIAGVAVVSPRRSLNGLAGFEEKSALFSGEAVLYEYNEQAKDWKILDGAEVGTVLARNLGIKEGDIINLLIGFEGFSFPVKRIVATLSEELDRVYLKVPLLPVQEALADGRVDAFSITLNDGGSLEKVMDDLSVLLKNNTEKLKAVTYNNSDSFLQSIINIYMNNYYFILTVIALTSFFAIANAITLSIMERGKELGTMRSFGIRKKHLAGLFLCEGLLLGACGFLTGVCLYLAAMAVINASGGIYIPPPPTVEKGFYSLINPAPLPVVLAGILSLTVSFLASLLATLKINALTIMDELHFI